MQHWAKHISLTAMVALQETAGPFDAVVIATPLEQANLSFQGHTLPQLPARKYQRTVTTYVRGTLRPSAFGESKMPRGGSLRGLAPLPARRNLVLLSSCPGYTTERLCRGHHDN